MTTPPTNEPTRDEEIQAIHRQYPRLYRITLELTLAVILVGIGIWIGTQLFRDEDAGGYRVNLYTEVLSIAVTVLIIDALNRRRDERNAEKTLKAQLLREASSLSNEFAKNAIHQMRRINLEWLIGKEGLLQSATLLEANLQEAQLTGANLEASNLFLSNLQSASLREANLKNTDLRFANLKSSYCKQVELQKADLMFANLESADLEQANLEIVNLAHANLQGADLTGANLYGANLVGANLRNTNFRYSQMKLVKLEERDYGVLGVAEFDETTILPDGSHWTPDRDMREFTHPDEWQAEQAAKNAPPAD